MGKSFKCDSCNTIIEIDESWTEQDAINEKQTNFGNLSLEECAHVCDDCFKKIMAFNRHKIDDS